MESRHAIVTFDGLSAAGKSTLAQMLLERSADAVVISENRLDPLRPATSRLNKTFKADPNMTYMAALDRFVAESSQFAGFAKDAQGYVQGLQLDMNPLAQQQATLAYFFAAGRSLVNQLFVSREIQKRDVILDRWRASGVYQAQPAAHGNGYAYSPQEILALNIQMGVCSPDMQVILTCPAEQIPQRKAYRQKEGVGTAGQMSTGREHIIYKAFMETLAWFQAHEKPAVHIENDGTPAEQLEEQVRQAIPSYLRLESALRDSMNGRDNNFFYGLTPHVFRNHAEAEKFFLQPDVLGRIYERQTGKL